MPIYGTIAVTAVLQKIDSNIHGIFCRMILKARKFSENASRKVIFSSFFMQTAPFPQILSAVIPALDTEQLRVFAALGH